jgi:hypothetical protein
MTERKQAGLWVTLRCTHATACYLPRTPAHDGRAFAITRIAYLLIGGRLVRPLGLFSLQ